MNNRTTTVVVNHSLATEFKKAVRGVPMIGHEELSFAGQTLAAKWMLAHKKLLKGAREFYAKFWDHNGEWSMRFYWGGSKLSFDETMSEIEQFAENKDEQNVDLEYARKGLTPINC